VGCRVSSTDPLGRRRATPGSRWPTGTRVSRANGQAVGVDEAKLLIARSMARRCAATDRRAWAKSSSAAWSVTIRVPSSQSLDHGMAAANWNPFAETTAAATGYE